MLALAVAVRALGQQVRLCVPPNFLDWVGGYGFEVAPMGVEMRLPRSGAPATPRETMPDLITDQFESVAAAADGCDAILGANAHQYAAPSIAELAGIPYVNALYAAVALPSPDHAPPPAPAQVWTPGEPADNERRWEDTYASWNNRSLERINHNRTRLGLKPIEDVLRYVLTDHPWLAADATLGPAPTTPGRQVTQTGAWLLPDDSPLPAELQTFLDAGDPPVYLGFGSMPVTPETSRTLIAAARAAGRRIILSQGWADLGLIDDARDCIAIGDVNQQALFPRVAAVVHHGGAGTTTAAARAGSPQVVVSMFSDQFYWGSRVRALGIGSTLANAELTAQALTTALRDALTPAVAAQARTIAGQITPDGAAVAARRLVEMLA
ncbi:glycosyltransferase [Fodinicola feengrottensis]|uniref:Glycosyltransferase n=1 Tax=Fodinicola feengrottensis TaxID=435914 RepID=A0ABN2G1W9_9ACTN